MSDKSPNLGRRALMEIFRDFGRFGGTLGRILKELYKSLNSPQVPPEQYQQALELIEELEGQVKQLQANRIEDQETIRELKEQTEQDTKLIQELLRAALEQDKRILEAIEYLRTSAENADKEQVNRWRELQHRLWMVLAGLAGVTSTALYEAYIQEKLYPLIKDLPSQAQDMWQEYIRSLQIERQPPSPLPTFESPVATPELKIEPPSAKDLTFVWPINGSIKLSQRFWSAHPEIDIEATLGAPVKAAASGIVRVAEEGWNQGFGNYIIIAHEAGYSTRYQHLDTLHVWRNQFVFQGQMIGRIGVTGNTTGPHLGFAILYYNKEHDPLKWLGTPARIVDWYSYKVIKGDTLELIAREFRVTINDILTANNLDQASPIIPGTMLSIPVDETRLPKKIPPRPHSRIVGYKEYTVRTVDTVIGICNKFGITMEELREANNLSLSSIIRPGDILTIPIYEI